MKNRLLALYLVLIASSCSNTVMDPKDIYEKYRSSVVLIKNDYFFAVNFDNDLAFYYTVSKDGIPKLHKDQSEAIKNASTSFGTGFFISDKGEIATNRHVIYPEKADEKIGELINKYLVDYKIELEQIINENVVQNEKIEAFYDKYYSSLEFDQISDLKDAYLQKKNKIAELKATLSTLDFDPKKTKIEMVTTSLGIAFDNTHVTTSSDFIPCVPIKKSGIEDVDLAIIQLKDKTTPTKIKSYFNISNLGAAHKLSMNDKVYMIGFNMGFALAKTDDGVKSQLTSGEISQDPDTKRILYSIPTLSGSSGSPIINKFGELVSINFAKVSGEQNFNFGIPVIYLVNLHKSQSYESEPDNLIAIENSTSVNNNVTTNRANFEPSTVSDFSDNIRNYTRAEETEDFDQIYSYYSENLKRYWDMYNPSYNSLKERYEHLWNVTSERKNEIERIEKINNTEYNLYTTFTYYSNKKQQTISKFSKVRFVFDQQGKIIETYGL